MPPGLHAVVALQPAIDRRRKAGLCALEDRGRRGAARALGEQAFAHAARQREDKSARPAPAGGRRRAARALPANAPCWPNRRRAAAGCACRVRPRAPRPCRRPCAAAAARDRRCAEADRDAAGLRRRSLCRRTSLELPGHEQAAPQRDRRPHRSRHISAGPPPSDGSARCRQCASGNTGGTTLPRSGMRAGPCSQPHPARNIPERGIAAEQLVTAEAGDRGLEAELAGRLADEPGVDAVDLG